MTEESQLPEIKLDAENLHREENITDLQAGSIRRLIPITVDGEPDDSRPVRYEGHTTLLTPAGQLPIHFLLETESLKEAVEQFPEAAQKAIKETFDELQRLRREQQSSIVVPGQGGQGGPGAPGGGPGGMPPGSGIQMP